MSAVTTLETGRLLLRRFQDGDAEAMSAWCSDPEVTETVTWNAHKDLEETRRVLANWIKAYDDPRNIRFGIVLKETNELMGVIDVINFHDDIPEIGYCLAKKYWGKGYMSEAVRAMVRHVFHLGYNEILACMHEENIGSIRVITRCGFRFERKEFKAQWSPFKLETVVLNWYHLFKDE